MILRLSLDLPEDQEFVRTTRLLSRTLLDDLRVIEEDKYDIETIVTELCTNVIRHAKSSEGRYHLAIEYHRDKAVITVEDQGVGFAPDTAPEPGTHRSDTLTGGERIGGFGMPLVKLLSDRVQFALTEPQGMTVMAEKTLRYESRRDRARAGKMDATEGGQINATLK
ncbi:MAG: ATP-binding protein [Armatimonadota bacterium]